MILWIAVGDQKPFNYEYAENSSDPLHDFEGTALSPLLGEKVQNFATLVDIVMLL